MRKKCSEIDIEINKIKSNIKNEIMEKYKFLDENIYNLIYAFTEKYSEFNVQKKNSNIFSKNINNFNKNIKNLNIKNLDRLTIFTIFILLQPYVKNINALKKNYDDCNSNVYHYTL